MKYKTASSTQTNLLRSRTFCPFSLVYPPRSEFRVQNELKLTSTQQDVLIYANDIEVNLRNENANLARRLQDAELDLDDARRSRRELQQQLKETNQRMAQLKMDNENLKVNAAAGVYSGRKLTWAES